MTGRSTVAAVLAAGMCGAGLAAQGPAVPHRVYAAARRAIADLPTIARDARTADVLVVGEQHLDDGTHRVELALLEALSADGRDVVLALEMFERDVQGPLAHFLMGQLSEDEFLGAARPWPRYQTDYKPLVDLAIARHWPVVAANVPRAIAAEVSQRGLRVLEGRPEAERAWFARDLHCSPSGAIYERFRRTMTGMAGPASDAAASASASASLDRYYAAQCLKDETMAESIAQAHAAGRLVGKRPLIVSVNGAFHSDGRGALIDGLARRMAGARLLVVSIQPVTALESAVPPAGEASPADYVIYTLGDLAAAQQEVGTPIGAHDR